MKKLVSIFFMLLITFGALHCMNDKAQEQKYFEQISISLNNSPVKNDFCFWVENMMRINVAAVEVGTKFAQHYKACIHKQTMIALKALIATQSVEKRNSFIQLLIQFTEIYELVDEEPSFAWLMLKTHNKLRKSNQEWFEKHGQMDSIDNEGPIMSQLKLEFNKNTASLHTMYEKAFAEYEHMMRAKHFGTILN